MDDEERMGRWRGMSGEDVERVEDNLEGARVEYENEEVIMQWSGR